MKNKVERGDIYWYNFGQNEGSVQNGIRPALVIQATNFNANSPTTIIAAITTAQKGMYLPSHIFLGERYGLDRPSTVMLEQIRTVNQNELGPYIGTVEDHTTLNAISKALKKPMGCGFIMRPRTTCVVSVKDAWMNIETATSTLSPDETRSRKKRNPAIDAATLVTITF